MPKKAKTKSSPHVPEQLRGFTAQETRMAYLLLTSPEGAIVSLEKLDDVAVEHSDGTIQVVQNKDIEGHNNPVSNRSVQMWKTFANWVREIHAKRLDPTRTRFEIFVSRKVTGPLVKRFHEATTKSTATEAFDAARELLWGASPHFSKKSEIADSLREHLEEVFSAKGAKTFRQIIERFHLECAKSNPELDLWAELRKQLRFENEDIVLEVLADVRGWLKKLIDEQLRQRKAPTIAVTEFMCLLRASFMKLRPGGALPDLGGKGPTPTQVAGMMCERFVHQMELINLEEDSRNRAIACFFKARTARTKWAQRGDALVHHDNIHEFEEGLRQEWRDIRTEVFSDTHRTDEVLKGQILLAKCQRHTRTVEGKIVPEYFIPGCFHELANRLSDLGWRPRFETLLQTSTP